MNSSLQTFLALSIVVFVVIAFAWHWWRRRKKGVCGGSCGCASAKRNYSGNKPNR